MTEERRKEFDKAWDDFEEHFKDDPTYGLVEGAKHMTEEELEKAIYGMSER